MGSISEESQVIAEVDIEVLPDPCSILGQLMALPLPEQQIKRQAPRRPAGEIRPGGASEAVLDYLVAVGGFRTEAQIRFATGRSHAAVSWALLFLKGRGLVKAVPDVARNTRYCRYCAMERKG